MAEFSRQTPVKVVICPNGSGVGWSEATGEIVTVPPDALGGYDIPRLSFEPNGFETQKTKKKLKSSKIAIAFQSFTGSPGNYDDVINGTYGEIVCRRWQFITSHFYFTYPVYNSAEHGISRSRTSYDAQMYTHHSALFAPYQHDVLEDILVTPVNMSPSAFTDASETVRFSWGITTAVGEDGIERFQQSATIQWKAANSDTVHTQEVGADHYHDFEAGVFPAGSSFQWRVKIISDDDVDSGWSDWVTVSTTDAAGVVRSLSPNNVAIDGSAVNRISWIYDNSYGTLPSKYDIELSTNGGASWAALQSEITANCYADIPADAFPAGNIQYRVRAYSQSGAPSEWAVANVTVRARPQKPSITAVSTDTDRPTVIWQSVGQEAYKLEIFDSANTLIYTMYLASQERSHTLTKRLDNGAYTAQLTTYNEYNLASLNATKGFTLAVTKPAQPIITGESYGTFNRLHPIFTTPRAVLIRDGVAIAVVSGVDVYDDYAAAATSTYILRALTDTAFSDSEPITISSVGSRARLSSAKDPAYLVELIYRAGSHPGRASTYESEYSTMSFAGRPLPVVEFGEHIGQTKTLSYSLHSPSDVDRLIVLSRGVVLWRDRYSRMYAVMSDLQIESRRGYFDVSFRLTEINYNEEVEYE